MRWVAWLALVASLASCDAIFGLSSGAVPPDAAPPVGWQAVAFGGAHACGIRADHTLWCWGRNDDGQLGLGSDAPIEVDTPAQIPGAWTAVAGGESHTCAIDVDGHMWCWGKDDGGQLGDAMTPTAGTSRPEPQQVGATTWIAVTAGLSHTCAVDTAGALWCWGDNDYSQIDPTSSGGQRAPTMIVQVQMPNMPPPTPPPPFIAVVADDDTTFALASDHHLWGLGFNYHGELGNALDTPAPLGQIGTDTYTQVSARGGTVCAVRDDGHLRCWGSGARGTLGNGTDQDQFIPMDIDPDTSWTAVAVGGDHACGIHAGGAVDCWGDNSYDQLTTAATDPFVSSPMSLGVSADALVLGPRQTCTLAGGTLQCAGAGGGGQLGDGQGSRLAPVKIGSADAVAVGRRFACAIGSGDLKCWGDGSFGGVGDGSQLDRDTPTTIGDANLWHDIAVGDHACALDMASHVWCWGNDGYGAVGAGAGGPVPMPIEADMTQVFTDLTASETSCAIDDTAALWCWGFNDSGQAGDLATPGMAVTPAPATAGTWKQVAAGLESTCAIDMNDQVWCWGSNSFGALGDGGSESARAMPGMVPLPTGSTAQSVVVGGYDACALTDSGYLCWGENDHGEFGDMTTDSRGTPKPLTKTYVDVSLGLAHSCGITGAGELFCWGANEHGQLGDGSLLERHAPAHVGTDTDWAKVSAGDDHTCAIKQNNDLYCWGRNSEGEVGDGSAWRATFAPIP